MTNDEVPGTRDRILIAAATMFGEDPTARLSVRAVAARAGVSTGSLRHFFPTQRLLLDEVAVGLTDLVMAGDVIHDTSMSASDRLVACLQQVLVLVGAGEQARQAWRKTFHDFVESEPSADAVEAYLALDRAGRRRIARWLDVLAQEGAIAPGDHERRVQFLSTLLNGLAVERALPVDGARLAAEAETLRFAVDAVLAERWPGPG